MSKAKYRLEKILECIEDIDFILKEKDLKITQAIEDKIIKPAIRMNIIRIAEQLSKLKDDNEFDILKNFSNEDLKGINSVRNFIAHDYDSTDDNIIEDIVRYRLKSFKIIIENIEENNTFNEVRKLLNEVNNNKNLEP